MDRPTTYSVAQFCS